MGCMINTIIRRISDGKFVLIAEIGVNYYDIATKMKISPMEAAKLMVTKAYESGVHAVKFQTYKADTLASKNSPSYWDTSEESETSQYSLFKKFDSFGIIEYKELSNYCNKIGIEFLSTPFDLESVDYLYDLMNVYKISSSDLNNTSFIEYIAKKDKPIILSTGASNKDEIDRAISIIRKHNKKPLVLMHCVLEYPTPYEHANLNKIISLKNEYQDAIIGYSDHTRPDAAYDILKTAYCLGASVIEKHFTLDKTLKGNDHYHAMDAIDAKKIIDAIRFIEEIRGSYNLTSLDTERIARKNARRSLVANVDIAAGQKIVEEMLTFKRPGCGITADNYYNVIGKTAAISIKADTILTYDMLK